MVGNKRTKAPLHESLNYNRVQYKSKRIKCRGEPIALQHTNIYERGAFLKKVIKINLEGPIFKPNFFCSDFCSDFQTQFLLQRFLQRFSNPISFAAIFAAIFKPNFFCEVQD